MAREECSVVLLTLLLSAPFLGPTPVRAQPGSEAGAAAEEDAVRARARLLEELDQQIEARRRELARQQEASAALELALEAAKRDLLEEGERLDALRREVEAGIARRQRLADERVEQLSRAYASMRPKEAALALAGMEDDRAAAILEGLPARSLGRIFDEMPKERVRELTRWIEGREAGPGARHDPGGAVAPSVPR